MSAGYRNAITYKENYMHPGSAAPSYAAQEDKPELPLLDYATQEIQRLTADIAHEIANLNGFVDSVRGPRPELMNATTGYSFINTAGSPIQGLGNISLSGNVLAPPNRGNALREAIRALQVLRNDATEAVARLGAI